jgi:hypothetical protein
MKIKISTDLDGTLRPRVLNVIRGVPESIWKNEIHSLAPPIALFSRSLNKICSNWLAAIELIDRNTLMLSLGQEIKKSDEILDAYKLVLYALNEHIDTCYSVLRCLCPKTQPKVRFDEQACKDQKIVGLDRFEEQVVKGYRQIRLGAIVNKLKHSQGQLNLIYARTTTDVRLGYFVNSVSTSGVNHPNKEIHTDGNTAFTFARDMMINFWWLYRSSEILSDCIMGTCNAWNGIQVTPTLLETSQEDLNWSRLCKSISEISPAFFPDENFVPFPDIRYPTNGSWISVEFPTSRKAIRTKDALTFSVLSTVEEGALTIKSPYFGAPFTTRS